MPISSNRIYLDNTFDYLALELYYSLMNQLRERVPAPSAAIPHLDQIQALVFDNFGAPADYVNEILQKPTTTTTTLNNDQGELIGVAVAVPSVEYHVQADDYVGRTSHVLWAVVREDSRGKGRAVELIEQLEEELKNTDVSYLELMLQTSDGKRRNPAKLAVERYGNRIVKKHWFRDYQDVIEHLLIQVDLRDPSKED